jgi:transposase
MECCRGDLHAEHSQICFLDEDGEVMTSRVRTSQKALERLFGRDRRRVAREAGGTSPWVSRLLAALGYEAVVCSPRRVRLIAESTLKNDKVDAQVLARQVRLDPGFLKPNRHRSDEAQRLRGNLKVRSAMVEARTKWINTVRGMLHSLDYEVSGKASHTFVERVYLMKLADDFRAVIAPLLEQLDLRIQAAHACLLTKADSQLKRWARALAERRDGGKAVVALVRKVAVMTHRLWATGEVCQSFPKRETSQAA